MPGLVSRWTNPSVLRFAEGKDPVEIITARARMVALQALDSGWSGPPFDPLALADLLGIEVVPRSEVTEARTTWRDASGFRIEYNPGRSIGRVRFNIAHEIAHTLFPDCSTKIRHRGTHEGMKGDEWQLESLCNIAAAEFLMPVAQFPHLPKARYTIEQVLELRERFQASVEAVLIRMVRLAPFPCACFVALRNEGPSGDYRLVYLVSSGQWPFRIPRGTVLPASSGVGHCTAIGHTSRTTETWTGAKGRLDVECVGIPPYPGLRYPRVAGLLRPHGGIGNSAPQMTVVRGDALEPRGKGRKIIAHIVNDRTANWGGRGFAQQVAKSRPEVQRAFREAASQRRTVLKLGSTHFFKQEGEIEFAQMVAQKGYGPSSSPRIRYAALRTCLTEVAERAFHEGATVHMPVIGTGQAGGAWQVIDEIIRETLGTLGVPVTVYVLPSAPLPSMTAAAPEFAGAL